MIVLAPVAPSGLPLPALIATADTGAQTRFLEFFAATIRNAHTRRAYARSAWDFMNWCECRGVVALAQIRPLHVAAWVEELGRQSAVPTVKQRLAGVRHLFDWLVRTQVIAANPAASVRGPAYSQQRGRTPVLDAAEARAILDAIDPTTATGLRDRALIGVMVYGFARIGAALAMRVEDAYVQNRRLWIRLHEKGGKRHELPCHHRLEDHLHAYIDGCGLADDRRGPLFRGISRGTGLLTTTSLPQASAHRMVRRRADAAGIATAIGNHSFRATGITAYLRNGGTLERAAAMAGHASTRTTQLYDRRADMVTLDEVERVLI
jgi:integrase/recombinase XerC